MAQSDDEDRDSRTHDPTPKRLEDARRKGDIAKSTDLTGTAAVIGLVIAGAIAPSVLGTAFHAARGLLEQAHELSRQAAEGGLAALSGPATAMIAVLGLFLGLPAAASLLALIAQRAVVVAPEKLLPRLSRINPIANARQKFGPEGLVEFLKSLCKMILLGGVLGYVLSHDLGSMALTSMLTPEQGLLFLWQSIGKFLGLVALVTLVIGGFDLVWQKHALRKRNRMTRKDMTDEHKEQEGDPHSKSARRQRGQDIAMNQMLTAVPDASVVIVNPTHFAVALKWLRGSGQPPVVVAKGMDGVALQIRKVAAEAGVPIHADPPTARALFATVGIGEPIHRGHFEAVAAAIRFSETLRRRSGRGSQ